MQPIIHAVVVDVSTSAILCYAQTQRPYLVPIPRAQIHTLPKQHYVTIPPTQNSFFATTPDIILSIHALSLLGIPQSPDSCWLAYRYLVSALDTKELAGCSYALQLLRWQEEHQFCGRCGNKTWQSATENARICTHCHHPSYPRISPCIIVAIMRHCPQTHARQILLAKHHKHTDGMYGLVAGFVEIGESLEEAVCREVYEEVGLTIQNIRYIKSQTWPYPSNIMIGFLADFAGGTIVVDPQELIEAQFFDLNHLPKIPSRGTIAHALIHQATLLS